MVKKIISGGAVISGAEFILTLRSVDPMLLVDVIVEAAMKDPVLMMHNVTVRHSDVFAVIIALWILIKDREQRETMFIWAGAMC